MLRTVWGVVREGEINLLEDTPPLPEGASVLVTVFSVEDEGRFWLRASETSLADIWTNPEDDVYAELLQA